MDLLVALPPDLDLTPAEVAAAWNATPECRKAAAASVASAGTRGFVVDPALANSAVQLIGAVAAGVATGLLLEVLKRKLFQKQSPQQIEIYQVTTDVMFVEIKSPRK